MSTEGGASPGWRVLPAALLATANNVLESMGAQQDPPKFTACNPLDRKFPNGQMYVRMYVCAHARFTGAEILLGCKILMTQPCADLNFKPIVLSL